MKRFLVVMSFGAVALAACGGGGAGPSLGVQTQASAQSVAQSSSDFPGLQKCSESRSYESYLKAEETKNPDQYKTDKTTWEDVAAAGANDSYIAVYVAFWEIKQFEVALIAFNDAAEAPGAVTKINGRIR